MKTCPYCRHKNAMDAHFCAHCGQSFLSSKEDSTAKTDFISPMQTEENILTAISTLAPTQYDKTFIVDPKMVQEVHIDAEPMLQNTSPSRQEKERNRDFTPLLLPGGGQTAPTPAPMIQGTPQLTRVPTVQGTPHTVPPPAPAQPTTAKNGRPSRVSRSIRAVRHLVKGTGAKIGIVVIISVITAASVIHVLPHSSADSHSQIAGSPVTKGAHALKTESVPSTQTTCPTAGNARAAVTAPLALGKNDTFISVDNSTGPTDNSGFSIGVLKRYDVTTGKATELAHIDNELIGNARLSADGQWVLFETTKSTDIGFGPPPPPVATNLYMVRVDGQGLQTVYCSSGRNMADVISNESISWSPDRKYIAFSEVDTQGNEHLTVLNTTTGMLQRELTTQQNQGLASTYEPLAWLDNTHLYLTYVGLVNNLSTEQGMYMLDINAGANKQSGNLKTIVNPQEMANQKWGFALSLDRKLLYLSLAPFFEPGTGLTLSGRSSITVRSVAGGASTSIYSTTTQTIDGIQVINATTLRFYMGPLSSNPDNQAGYWTVKTNGTGLTRLNYTSAIQQSSANSISPDNKFIAYVAESSQPNTAYTTTLHIKIVPSHGGQIVAVADSNHPLLDNSTGDLKLVGWTTSE